MSAPASDALVIARTPLRLSLGGGGTDLPYYAEHHGADITTVAISLWVTVVARTGRVDGQFRFSYQQTDLAPSPERMADPYVREALDVTGVHEPVEIVSLGPVPSGTGLGSSGAFAVSLLAALHELAGSRPEPAELAEQAFRLEADRLGRPVGRQDHYACALGGLRRLMFDADGPVATPELSVARALARAHRRHDLDPHARTVLHTLREHGVRIGALVDDPEQLAGLPTPDVVVPGTRVGEALDRLGVPAEDCWFVGSAVAPLLAARAAGIGRVMALARYGRHRAMPGIPTIDELAALTLPDPTTDGTAGLVDVGEAARLADVTVRALSTLWDPDAQGISAPMWVRTQRLGNAVLDALTRIAAGAQLPVPLTPTLEALRSAPLRSPPSTTRPSRVPTIGWWLSSRTPSRATATWSNRWSTATSTRRTAGPTSAAGRTTSGRSPPAGPNDTCASWTPT
jgi:beta-phosphoglucomutase-like phosphatase (HAD superfamily)